MYPLIQDGELLHMEGAEIGTLRLGDIVVAKTLHGIRAHRLVFFDIERDLFLTRGDTAQENDPPIRASEILGRVVLGKARGGGVPPFSKITCSGRSRLALRRFLGSLLFVMMTAALLSGQVTLNDAASTGAGRPNGSGNFTFNHNTANNANRLLVVGVSMNIVSNPNATITSITYNGVALTKLGAHNDAGDSRRVEIWYLINPVTGNQTIQVNYNLPLGARVGITAGALVFKGVDQTVPLSTIVSNDGAGGTFSQLDIPSGTNQVVFDVLSVLVGDAITKGPAGTTTQQWNLDSGNNRPQDVQGFGSTNIGAASVPMSETFTPASNWSIAGASVMPLQADLGVTVNPGGAVPLGQNVTYNITVTNNGPSAATGVSLTDTLAAGLGFVSATPSQGTCSGTGPITCNIGTLAGGASATVSVVASAAATGSYANTASVTATQPDFNTGNNFYTAVAVVQTTSCAAPASLGDGGTLTGVVNTYYPATANVSAGTANTSIPLGTPRGAAATLAAGDLLLVMQMQDADIDSSNDATYGNGSTGSGFTAINNAGNYEFVKATGPVSSGAVPIAGSGPNGGLVYSYTIAAATGTKGKSTYQVIRVPQYATATLGSGLTAAPWDGSSGGVLALDIAGALTLGSATVSVDGLGFRGGAGMQLNGAAGASTDYVHASPTAYTGTVAAGADGSKGEGVAGTPRWVQSGNSFLDTGIDGYPNGGTARGAPANGGGGGTDGNPPNNDQNAGGGGGSNGGVGGWGGNSWNSTLGIGGLGGSSFPATLGRLGLGGGGGAGSRNNSDTDNQASAGAAGGGIVYIRAGSLSGTATLTANGASAYNGTANDAGGGGGAGGTIVVLSAGGGEGGLSVQARGGNGGNAWTSHAFALTERHGPGGGGGGGVVYLSGAASINVSGGVNGTTLNTPAVAYGATSGTAGVAITNAQISQGSGSQSGAACAPDVTILKTHTGTFTRGGTGSFTVVVSNVAALGPTSGTVTMNDTFPSGLVPTGANGTGWSCAVAGQTATCVRSDALAAGSSYPAITINAAVSQNAPATMANTAVVSGGGEVNPNNDTSTDTVTIGSSSDLAVTNAGAPNPVAAGSNITYTQIVTNNGPSDATGVNFVEAIPANTTLQSVTPPSGWACSIPGNTGTFTCAASVLAASTSGTFTVIVRVNTGTANGTVITDTAAVNSAISDPVSSNNSATVAIIVGPSSGVQADLSVTDAAVPNPVTPNGTITYTQVVRNTGSVAAFTATFSEATPVNTTFLAFTPPLGWTCSTPAVGATGTVSCTNASVAGGSVGNFQLQVKVNGTATAGTTITNTVTVGAANDANAGDNTDSASVIVATATQADLAISTSTNPSGFVLAGNNLVYTQTITNNGPAASGATTFTQAVPANTTYQSVLFPAGWSCSTPAVGATGTVTCTNSGLPAGTVANIDVTVNVNASDANGSVITATSTMSSTTGDPTNTNNTTTVTTTVGAAVNLTATNSGTPSPVLAGNNITYTQSVINRGPSNAATVSFTEAVPANTTFVSATTPGTWACSLPPVGGTGNLSCSITTLAPNTTTNFQFVVKVTAGTPTGTIITDTATVTTATRDTVPGDNTATVKIAVGATGQADLSVTNVGAPDPVTAGNNITYTQVAGNGGPSNATTVSFTEAIPANTTFVSLPIPAGWGCTTPPVGNTGTITCTIATLTSGANATFVVTVKVNTNTPNGTLITDTDNISSAITDPNSGNNSASSLIAVGASADLAITNADAPDPVQAGNNITYTQVVTNPGPSNAVNVSVTESTPANTNFHSLATPGGWGCTTPAVGATGTITCTIASLAPGTTTFNPVLQVNAGTTSGTIITDSVVVTSTTDSNAANNTATTTTVVATATQADLAMSNSPSAPNAAAGSNVTFSQNVTNNGPATANTLTLTENIPLNTTFQSLAAGAWTCIPPAVGSTTPFTCTLSALNAAASSPILVTVQINSSTPSGTVIADTASVAATTSDPTLANNAATATLTVGTGNSADVSIVKTAAPSPVAQGNLLAYTLTVTNSGPADASNVTVVDALPSALQFVSVTTTAGTCSQASNIVTCLIGTLTNSSTATVNIVVTPLSSTVITNTATVTADQDDSTPNNNSSTISTLITAPTRIHLQALTAEAGTQGVVLRWKTAGEFNNLGFNVYREQNGERQKLNPTLVAGSALTLSGYQEKHAGRSYAWIDKTGTPGTLYWLEDLDLNGERTLHGPISSSISGSSTRTAASPMMSDIATAQSEVPSESHVVPYVYRASSITKAQSQQQFDLAAQPAVKIMADHEGWYRVTQPDLVAAGLDRNADPSTLRLFAEAIEQPILVTGAQQGHGGFGPNAAIEFYGTGMDTPFSATRVYWLIAGNQPGLRINYLTQLPNKNAYLQQFTDAVELRQRTTYFAALLNSDDENFFGALVSATPVDQVVTTPHFTATGNLNPHIEVVLQGVGAFVPHEVAIAVNGASLGHVLFTGQSKGRLKMEVPSGVLVDGANTVTLTALDGDSDISLMDHITITYGRSYGAENDQLKFTARAGAAVQVSNFQVNTVRIFDVTNASQPVELAARMVSGGDGTYTAQLQVPWSPSGRHTLLAMGTDQLSKASQLAFNQPSNWHSTQPGSQMVVITHPSLAAAVSPLVDLRRKQGYSVSVVQTDDIYDEFSFGEHSPQAMRDFLQAATANWTTKPGYLLLNGDASVDPRNFLGFGDFDFVPTRIIPTPHLMTASDDWFSDFNNIGLPTLATGRLAVRTPADGHTVVSKIVEYEKASGPWTNQTLIVADRNDTDDFTKDSQAIAAKLPSDMQVTNIFATDIDPGVARSQVLNALNSGELLVNYIGHGSVEVWSGENLLINETAASLTNAPRLPVMLSIDCLNGFFHDVYTQSLAETLMLNPQGGAVAVVSSSGLTNAPPQFHLDRSLVQALFQKNTTLGDALIQAKSSIKDDDVRRTYLLFGDPLTRLKFNLPQH